MTNARAQSIGGLRVMGNKSRRFMQEDIAKAY